MKTSRKISKRVMVSVGAGIMLALLYGLIFRFSAQDADESGSLSRAVSEKCVEVISSLSGRQWSLERKEQWAEYLEHPIRKMAHFTEYACMGVLVYVLWSQWVKRGKALYLLTVAWVAVSAAADEFHQLFVPGRDGNLRDVCLDTLGGAAGMLFCILAGKILLRRRRRITSECGANTPPTPEA